MLEYKGIIDLSEEDLTLFEESAYFTMICQKENKFLCMRGFEMYFEMLITGFIIPRHSIIRVVLEHAPQYVFISYLVQDDGDLMDLENKYLYDPEVVLSLSYAPLGWSLVNPVGDNLLQAN